MDLGQEWGYDRRYLELFKPRTYTLKSLALSLWYHSFIVALTLTSLWVLGTIPCSDHETLVCFMKAIGLLCLVTGLPYTYEETSPQIWEVMWKPWLLSLRLPGLLETLALPLLLVLHTTLLCSTSSKLASHHLLNSQVSSDFLGSSLFSQALHFEIHHGVPFSTVLKPLIMSFPLATDHSRGGPSYFNFGSILPSLAFSSATFSWRENEVETVGGMKAHPCTPSIAFPWPAQMHS